MLKHLSLAVYLCLGTAFATVNTPITTTLTANVSASTRTLPVASVTGISPMSEIVIQSERILVCQVNSPLKTLFVCASGRGRAGSTPATHASGATVLLNPNVQKASDGSVVIGDLTTPVASITTANVTTENVTTSNVTTAAIAKLLLTPSTPANAAAACTAHAVWYDAGFLYVCVATGDIRRVAVATWP